MGSAITGWGSALPRREVSSAELEARFDLPAGWIEERTGIAARRYAGEGETTTALAIGAGTEALRRARRSANDIDLVIVATCTPDVSLPPTAALVQAGLGADDAGAVDVGAACAGFLYGLAQAQAFIAAGSARRILVCGAETMSRSVQDVDPRTAVLFGDGAAAVVVEEVPGAPELGPFLLGSDGSRPDLLWANITDRQIHMQGRSVYLRAVKEMAAAVEASVRRAGLSLDEVDLVVAHQANARILDAVAEHLRLDPHRAYCNIARVGNTSGASIPLALCDAAAEGRLRPGDKVVLTAFGAGFLWGSAVVEWHEVRGRQGHKGRHDELATHV